jgi:N-methylhydantoinase A/oxoprolinase/acetone carboxylase beta subunit
MRVGVDTGGTFTDAVADDGTIVKVPSTPHDPGLALRDSIEVLSGSRPDVLAHGTTVATNALLERRGARVALLCTSGFGDELEIARQARPSLYDVFADRPEPLVPRELRIDVVERVAADGTVLTPLDVACVPTRIDADAVAICLLHADLWPAHEESLAAALRARGYDVTCSHEVSPEFREYERMVTTVANAYLRPVCGDYLRGLAGVAADALVMTSAGGLIDAGDAAARPVALLLSGPAGGVRAAAAVATACGFADAVAFDMGGTSTDVCLVRGGVPEPAPSLLIGGLPIRMPAIAIHTIGAGGGSIAAIDPGGALGVGPRSAGAVPGPACYGRGGEQATVTDADLVLGRIPAGHPFAGLGVLDVGAARAALERAGVMAEGVVTVVDTLMAQAVSAVTVERGVDPRALPLVAFGGAGPLHACGVAEQLGMTTVIVPPRAGVFSAVGLWSAPRRFEIVCSASTESRERIAAARRAELDGFGDVDIRFDMRYAGQSHELTVGSDEDFHREHARVNGYARPDAPLEVTAVRASVTTDSGRSVADLPQVARASHEGPTVVAEPDCTLFLPDGWRADVGPLGAWVLTRGGDAR